MTSLVELSVEDLVAIVRLNRPDVRNAINDEMRAQFIAALDRAGNDEAVRAVVLTGNGKSFCSGATFPACAIGCRRPPERWHSTAGGGSSKLTGALRRSTAWER